jgi:hypothetical protein
MGLTVHYIPLPPEREAQWWAAMRWIWELLKEMKRSSGRGELRFHWIGGRGRDALAVEEYSTVVLD